eukprot:CAMPEP_0204371600 /NCGR_PEP_ID=MMETSP0469-20131031/46618_1 /ASSEMBLY_ACC=CAM_ASM_000384 /TAXON_ID=2969 /ORGANISM="Oxyrrhis marina" /LENGTH=73 /DNA_ID=CAMNT_0051361733 /DNA_START=1 /DNA_END=218 /DNA_ORIENTATION=-
MSSAVSDSLAEHGKFSYYHAHAEQHPPPEEPTLLETAPAAVSESTPLVLKYGWEQTDEKVKLYCFLEDQDPPV